MNNPRGSFRNAKELLGEIQYAVEVGVREGKNSEAMLDAGCKRLICVDDYPECVEHWIEAKGPVKITREMQDAFKANMVLGLKKYGDRVRYLNMSSVAASEKIKDGSIDYVYIDADHNYEHVMADILAWYPKVRSGGVLAGHDYAKDGYEGVVQAVQEFAQKNGLQVHVCTESDWMVVKP